MKFTLTIDCNNAAFDGDGRDESDGVNREVSRILGRVSAQLLQYRLLIDGDEEFLRDVNGNKVGSWKVEGA